MKEITIRLELLRSGPAHNQLLSPLTPYLAVCGNRAPETVNLSAEHLDTLERLDRLRYLDGRQATSGELRAAAEPVARMLRSIEGLQKELAIAQHERAEVVHLRLILSAQELSLLPFELAQAPAELGGLPPLGFAIPAPVVLTRESRREAGSVGPWPDRPKILLVMADPTGRGLPRGAHLLALRRALAPWMDSSPLPEARTEAGEDLADYLTVLDQATLQKIADTCASTAFTHVHVLCHGAKSPGREGTFGLSLHDSTDLRQEQWVDGTRLASALLAGAAHRDGRGPSVVSLAVCDAGNVETVVRPNASVAHALHAAGIPLVVGSQLPLTFGGSAVMTEGLYAGLLTGRSPIEVLAEVRAALMRTLPRTQDWAALTVYSSLPPDFAQQLHAAKAESLKMRVELPLQTYDRFGLAPANAREDLGEVAERGGRLLQDKGYALVLEEAVAAARTQGPEALMRYASSFKRVATLGLHYDPEHPSDDADALRNADRLRLLRRSQAVVEEVFAKSRSAWSAVQRATLRLVFDHLDATTTDPQRQGHEFSRLWKGARFLVDEERHVLGVGGRLEGLDRRAMEIVDAEALAVQLWVLAAAHEDLHAEADAEALTRMCGHVRAKPSYRDSRGYSLLREMHRFAGWWFALDDEVSKAVRARAEKVIRALVEVKVEARYRPLRERRVRSPSGG